MCVQSIVHLNARIQNETQEGKFVIDPNEDPFTTADEQHRRRVPRSRDDDEGGFEVELPPNRFRTRSVAIVAGYSPERLYSNMPAGAFVVESGMYKMNRRAEGGEKWERPEAVYWKQVNCNMYSYILLFLGYCLAQTSNVLHPSKYFILSKFVFDVSSSSERTLDYI